jgi:hypothetical protein
MTVVTVQSEGGFWVDSEHRRAVVVAVGMLLPCAIVIAAVEAALRLVELTTPQPPPTRQIETMFGGGTSSSHFGIEHHHDRSGYRSDSAKWPKRCDVLCVGDSYTYGFAVAAGEAWPAQLAVLTGLRVINAGRCGDDGQEIVDNVAALVPRLRPRVLVYAICPNDHMQPGSPDIAAPVVPVECGYWAIGRLIGRATRPDYITMLRRALPGDLPSYRRQMAEMARVCRANGTRIVAVPLVNLPGRADLRAISEALADACREVGMEVMPTVQPRSAMVANRWDWHPSPEFHRLTAETVHDHLWGEADGSVR